MQYNILSSQTKVLIFLFCMISATSPKRYARENAQNSKQKKLFLVKKSWVCFFLCRKTKYCRKTENTLWSILCLLHIRTRCSWCDSRDANRSANLEYSSKAESSNKFNFHYFV